MAALVSFSAGGNGADLPGQTGGPHPTGPAFARFRGQPAWGHSLVECHDVVFAVRPASRSPRCPGEMAGSIQRFSSGRRLGEGYRSRAAPKRASEADPEARSTSSDPDIALSSHGPLLTATRDTRRSRPSNGSCAPFARTFPPENSTHRNQGFRFLAVFAKLVRVSQEIQRRSRNRLCPQRSYTGGSHGQRSIESGCHRPEHG